ncbi:Plant protein of unknown function (DUF868 [Striga hermonthica]|uniref:Uncharacterized protein n=1 Tax=Striga hermonthica TaxID=68872 RepID=A0A9N7NAI3_STRHE|nr:Plant protein of unknown function (DUF868 [Striga hermonthica]
MKNIAICYSEHAVKVSDSYCSGASNPADVSIPNAVTSVYRVELATKKHLLISLTWRDNQLRSNHLFSVNIFENEDDSFSGSTKFSKIFGAPRGAKLYELNNGLKIEVVWDLSRAEYESRPEPITGFYVMILVDSQPGLILGDVEGEPEARKRVSDCRASPEFWLVSRGEYFSGEGLYSAKVRFCETGIYHDILVKLCGEDRVLSVYVDRKSVVEVRRLRWNFRGNATVFLDGVLVDLLWDVHDWLFEFGPRGKGYGAVFVFRRRRGSDSRLWLEDKCKSFEEGEREKGGFSFVICASRNPG